MSTIGTKFRVGAGRELSSGKQIGKGGEGAVYEVQGDPNLALKVYWDKKASERKDKILAMTAAGLHGASSFVAFPKETVYALDGAFVGFTMRRVGGHKPAHILYSPKSRKHEFSSIDFRFLVRAAANIARAIASVHAAGCVIGDINHSGFLVSDKATVTLIDADSFQVTAANKTYLCNVGTPDYTPPELQGHRFDRVKRDANHDNFGLAVLVFQMLFMGRHPFSGRYLDSGDMPLERAIGEFRFAYSSNKSTRMQPPPGVPVLQDFPTEVEVTFERAFSRQTQHARPRADEWVQILANLETELIQCRVTAAHHHPKSKSCPWCKMEQATPGFVAFAGVPQIAIPHAGAVDVRQLIALLNGIRGPKPLPNINSIVSGIAPQPSSASDVQKKAFQYRLISGSAAAIGVPLTMVGSIGTALGLALVAGATIALHIGPKAARSVRERAKSSEHDWTRVASAWTQLSNSVAGFTEKRKNASHYIDLIQGLGADEQRGLQKLELKKREAQLERFLERFRISSAKISKISSGRKATLASYGIETAADISRQALSRVPGFGPALVSNLIQWRSDIEARFIFNASEPLNPSAVAALRNIIGQRRTEYDLKARQEISSLTAFVASLDQQRATLERTARAAWQRLQDVRADEKQIEGPFGQITKYISYGFCALSLLLASQGTKVNDSKPQEAIVRKPDFAVTVQAPSIAPSSLPVNVPLPRPRPLSTYDIAFPAPIGPDPRHQKDEPFSNMGGPYIPPPTSPLPTRPNEIAPVAAPAKPIEVEKPPPLPEPIEIPTRRDNANSEKPDFRLFDPLQKVDAEKIQQSLIDLGLLEGTADGHWGARSQAALTQYRTMRLLGRDATWDERTQRSLLAEQPRQTVQQGTFQGSWTTVRGECSPPPIRIRGNRAVHDAGHCELRSLKVISANHWSGRAHCTANGDSWISNVTLQRNGNELRWRSEKGANTYFLCSD